MGNRIVIQTPRGAIIETATKAGKVSVRLEWDSSFAQRYTGNFNKAQQFVDNEVLRFCSARVPFQTGLLQKSGILGTVVGSGTVQYIAPYAAPQYYKYGTSRSYDANRGGMWFERGKASERSRILQGALRIAGGK